MLPNCPVIYDRRLTEECAKLRSTFCRFDYLIGVIMHQSAACPWGPPPGSLKDLSKCPSKPHQIPLVIGQKNSDKSPARWVQQ